MKFLTIPYVLVFLVITVNLYAKDYSKRILILGQSDNYQESLVLAESAAKTLALNLNLRNLDPYLGKHLSFDKETCSSANQQFPCYKPRSVDGTLGYISIEESRHYQNIPQKSFSVVALVDKKKSATFSVVLREIRKNFPKVMELQTEVGDNWVINY